VKSRRGVFDIRKQNFDKEDLDSFAIHLKKLRIKYGFTQSQLAFEAGLSLSAVARMETARINPTLNSVYKIARAMDIPLTELFDFELSRQ
jgi:transcriptional regulator with XRE-family HTH domain